MVRGVVALLMSWLLTSLLLCHSHYAIKFGSLSAFYLVTFEYLSTHHYVTVVDVPGGTNNNMAI
jgi:hypothetical protein